MDEDIRISAYHWLQNQVAIHGDVLPRNLLENGFFYKGQRITLIGAKGIWKPAIMKLPISITTTCNSPYNDEHSDKEGYLDYKYRGTDPLHPDNSGLREIMVKNIPLIYFLCIVPGKYLATWPVFIIGDSPDLLSFRIALDDEAYISEKLAGKVQDSQSDQIRRSYITTKFLQRAHQRKFRERVLLAYQNQCALCKLRHHELLDAAHIIGDKEETGLPIVQNGISLCKIHHAAFDKYIIGITPDYTIKVREDVLEEIDGPMLKYGLQSLENNKIILPRNKNFWPDRDRLAMRFEQFISRA